MSEWLESVAAALAKKVQVEKMAYIDTPGHLTVADAEVLQEVFSGVKHVVDIGTHHGRSAVAIAAVAERVTTIDHYRGDAQIGAPSFEGAKTNLRAAGCLGKVTQIDSCWQRALLAGHVHLDHGDGVFYDAAHTPRDLYEKDFLQMVLDRPDLTIAIHDYKPLEPDMAHAVAAVNWFEEVSGRRRHGPVPGSSVVWFERES